LTFCTLAEILEGCRGQGWAVPAFDILNHETVLAVLDAAAAERSPVILMVYSHPDSVARLPGLAALIRTEAARAGVPVCLQLDHCQDLDIIRAALDAGFSAVMFDGSTLPYADNVALTRQVVLEARARGVSVEAELGHVGRCDEDLTREESEQRLTRPEEAARFVAETGVDALAVAIGTAHGLYRDLPRLDFERLAALRQAVPVPIVLHGGSGTPDADVRRAVAGGICKVNVWTDIAVAMVAALKEQLAAPVDRCHLPEALDVARRRAQDVAQAKVRLLGASGKGA